MTINYRWSSNTLKLLSLLYKGVEHDLLWIPGKLPKNVFILLSTLPGRVGHVMCNACDQGQLIGENLYINCLKKLCVDCQVQL